LAILWFWGLLYHEQQINNRWYRKAPQITEQFGCLIFYHNIEDKNAAAISMQSPVPYDCWEPNRTRIFSIANVVPGLIAAIVLDLSDRFRCDESHSGLHLAFFDSRIVLVDCGHIHRPSYSQEPL